VIVSMKPDRGIRTNTIRGGLMRGRTLFRGSFYTGTKLEAADTANSRPRKPKPVLYSIRLRHVIVTISPSSKTSKSPRARSPLSRLAFPTASSAPSRKMRISRGSTSTAKSARAFPSIRPGTISTSSRSPTVHKQAEWRENLAAAR
jgi:hypothetical protein